jgi:hypothetical protein
MQSNITGAVKVVLAAEFYRGVFLLDGIRRVRESTGLEGLITRSKPFLHLKHHNDQ